MSSVSIDSKGACPAAEPATSGKTGGQQTPARGQRTKHLNSFLYLHEMHPFHPPFCTWRGGGAAPEILSSGPTS